MASRLKYADIVFDDKHKPAFTANLNDAKTEYTEINPGSLPQHKKREVTSTKKSANYVNISQKLTDARKMTYENVDVNEKQDVLELDVYEVQQDHDCLSMSSDRLQVRRGDFVQAEKIEAHRVLCYLAEQTDSPRGWIPLEKLKHAYRKSTDCRVAQQHCPTESSSENLVLPPREPNVHPIKKSPSDKHKSEPWFIGKLSRTDCERYFSQHAQQLDFVIRESTYRIGDFTLSVQFNFQVRHFPIKLTETNTYYIGKHHFKKLSHIIVYYQQHPLFYDETEQPVSLGKPLNKRILTPQSSC